MIKLPIPVGGYFSNNSTPYDKIGKCSTLNDWVAWRGMYKQQQNPINPANNNTTAFVHSLTWFESQNNSNLSALVVATGNNVVQYLNSDLDTIAVIGNNHWSSSTNLHWPTLQFADHILIGSSSEGLAWYYPAGYSGTYLGNCGVTAPANAASVANNGAGNLQGLYKYVITFVNTQGHESGPGPASAVHTANNNAIDLTSIDTGAAGTVSRKIYRTVNDGALYLYVDTIADNSTTTYTDDDADTSLGAEVDLEGSDAPPTNIRGLAIAGSRVYVLDSDSKIWPCKIDRTTALPNWEAYPSSLATQLPKAAGSDIIMNIFNIDTILYAATKKAIYSIIGDPFTGQRVTKIADIGMFNRWSWCYADLDQRYIFILTSDYRIVKMNSEGQYQVISADIRNALEEIENVKTVDQVTKGSPVLSYVPHLEQLWVSIVTGGDTFNNKTYIFDLVTNEWSYTSTGVNVNTYDSLRKRIWFSVNDSVRYIDSNSTYKATGTIQTYPFQVKDKPVTIGRIGIVCSTHPTASFVPPMLKVEYSLDNSGSVWKSEFVQITEDVYGSEVTSKAQPTVVYVPVHETCDSIIVKITTPDVDANKVGIEIYDLFLEVEEIEKVHEGDAEKDKR